MVDHPLSERSRRVVWEEVLDDPARRRVRRAISRGQALSDPGEAAVATDRSRDLRRGVKWVVLANVLVGLFLISLAFYLVALPATPSFWWFVSACSLAVVLSPALGGLRVRRLNQAIEANRSHGTDP